MKRNLVFLTALAAGLATSTLAAQAPAAAAAPAAPAAPQAIPAKIAIIDIEQTSAATHEGQKLVADLRKKYEPKENDIKSRAAELDSLRKQEQALPATASSEEHTSRLKAIETKEKSLQRDAEDVQASEQSDFQEAFGKLLEKVGASAVKYAQDKGFTLLMNQTRPQNQLPTLIWWAATTDISQAVVDAYDITSGVAAPPPSAPTPARKPAAPAPKPAAPSGK
jgi:outer membrane protein